MTQTNFDSTDREYSSFDDTLPRVQIPLGRDTAGLTIEGTFHAFAPSPFHDHDHTLLPAAREAYREYVDGGTGVGTTKVHMCDDCADRDDEYGPLGYLTTSGKVGDYRSPYTCPHTWREESTSVNGMTAGMWGAPSSWRLDLKIDGDDTRVLTDDADSPTYTLTIQEHDRYHADSDILGETTVELPDSDATLTGTVNGKEWEADVTHRGDTVSVAWRRVDATGETVSYTYEEGDRGPDREFVGVNVADEYANRDGYDTKDLATTVESRGRERECGSTDFTRVWPPQEVLNDEDIIPVPDLADDDVPNSASHISRIQNQCENSKSMDTMLREVAEAYDEYWDDNHVPDYVEYR